MTKRTPTSEREYCDVPKRQGSGTCTKPAGWGTDHPGIGACKLHGGATPGGKIAAAKVLSIKMGSPIDVSPNEALLYCVAVTAGEAHYCTIQIQKLQEDEYVGAPITHRHGMGPEGPVDETTEHPVELNIWIKARREALDRLARYSKMALEAGVEERRVRLAEDLARLLAPALKELLDDLKLTPKQKKDAPRLMQAALGKLEAAPMAMLSAGTNGSK